MSNLDKMFDIIKKCGGFKWGLEDTTEDAIKENGLKRRARIWGRKTD